MALKTTDFRQNSTEVHWKQLLCPTQQKTRKISIKEIQKRNYNLDLKNPNGNAKVAHKDPKEILREIERDEKKLESALGEIKKLL